MRAVLARGLARMAESGVPYGGGRSLYWIEPLASRHFHWPLAKAGVHTTAPAVRIKART